VPDGSSVDISRVIRFDYTDDTYLTMAHEAYQKWSQMPKYKDIFRTAPILAAMNNKSPRPWVEGVTAALSKHELPFTKLPHADAAHQAFPVLSGALASPGFSGYYNAQAGWADAQKAIAQLRDDCIEVGVSFTSGRAGSAVKFERASDGQIKAVHTAAGSKIEGEHFVLAAGAWSAGLAPMYNSTLSTAQVIAYLPLTEAEMKKYASLPIYANFSTGWFNFPPHEDTRMLKFAVHGWGYTRRPGPKEPNVDKSNISLPPPRVAKARPNFAPPDGEDRLRQGLREILPELADRQFDRMSVCWYTDTPRWVHVDVITEHTRAVTDSWVAVTLSWTTIRTTETCLWQLVAADSKYSACKHCPTY
jgi:sarcosine oxidase/L-pipecolate oxidase